jgi:hypothetical protein
VKWFASSRSKLTGLARLYGLLPVAAVALAYRQVPWFKFISDDMFLIPMNAFLRGPGALWQNLTHDYFWSSSGNSVPYWRPVTKGSWVLEYMLWGNWAGGFHLDQVLLLLLSTLGVVHLVRSSGGGRASAVVAGLLFGLNPNLVESTCSVMARSDVAMTAGSIWAIASWLAWIRAGRVRWLVVHVGCLLFAFGSKETAVTLLAVFGLWTGLEARERLAAEGADRRKVLERALVRLAPIVLVAMGYFLARRSVLGSRQGIPLTFDPLRFFLMGGQSLFSILPFQPFAHAHPLPRSIALAPVYAVTATVGWLALLATAVVVLRTRHRLAAGFVVWAIAALSPVLLVTDLNVPVAPGFIALAGRWVAPSAAAAAVLVGLVMDRVPWSHLRVAILGVTAVWTAWSLARSDANGFYRDQESLMRLQDQLYLATPAAKRTRVDDCDFLERSMLRSIEGGRTAEALAAFDRAQGCPDAGRFDLLRVRALVNQSRFAEAFPLAQALLAGGRMERRYHGEAYYLAGVAAEATGHLDLAEAWLRGARAIGNPACNLAVTLGRLLAKTGRVQEGATEYEAAAACAGSDPRPWLAAAVLWKQLGRSEEVARIVARVRALPLDREQRALLDRLVDAR